MAGLELTAPRTAPLRTTPAVKPSWGPVSRRARRTARGGFRHRAQRHGPAAEIRDRCDEHSVAPLDPVVLPGGTAAAAYLRPRAHRDAARERIICRLASISSRSTPGAQKPDCLLDLSSCSAAGSTTAPSRPTVAHQAPTVCATASRAGAWRLRVPHHVSIFLTLVGRF
jgi:hypothetical protein